MQLKCAACGAKGETNNPPKEFICSICGCVNVTVIKEEGAIQACGCLLPTSFEWTMPAGENGNPIVGYWYQSPSGTKMTRDEWIEAYHVDPHICLVWMRNGEAAKIRDDDIDLGGGWRSRRGGKRVPKKLGAVTK